MPLLTEGHINEFWACEGPRDICIPHSTWPLKIHCLSLDAVDALLQVPNAAYRLGQQPGFLALLHFYEMPEIARLILPRQAFPLPPPHSPSEWLETVSLGWELHQRGHQTPSWQEFMKVIASLMHGGSCTTCQHEGPCTS